MRRTDDGVTGSRPSTWQEATAVQCRPRRLHESSYVVWGFAAWLVDHTWFYNLGRSFFHHFDFHAIVHPGDLASRSRPCD